MRSQIDKLRQNLDNKESEIKDLEQENSLLRSQIELLENISNKHNDGR